MAFLITQGGTTLYKVDLSTGTATALTLPTGVTLSSTRRPVFAMLNSWVVMVNSPTVNLSIDPEGTVRKLVPRPPINPIKMAAGSSTGLTGAYRYGYTYIIKNSEGELLIETPMSPLSASVTLADNDANLKNISRSHDTITGRRIYRTLSGGDGSTLYHVMDIEDNVTTEINENAPDATLEQLPTQTGELVTPPGTLPGTRLKNVIEWKSRLWAVSDDPVLNDIVYSTDTNKVYAWGNQIVAFPTGRDKQGIIGFAARKNQLGLLKRNGLFQISGSASNPGISFSNINVSQIAFDKAGCESAETIVSINDRVFWLGRDGVYEWSDDGVQNITKSTVDPWFTTATYFNRSRFSNAFARYNEERNTYELHLAATGSSTEDRWVSYNLTAEKWYGPHKTGLFTPTAAGWMIDANGLPMTIVGGSNGVLYTGNSTTMRDGASTLIDADWYGPFHHGDKPDYEHCWLELSVLSKIEAAGSVTITPYTGDPNNPTTTATMTHDQTTGRELLARIGDGRTMRLRFQQATVNQAFALYGYEVPYFEIGRR